MLYSVSADLPKTKNNIPITFGSDRQNARMFFYLRIGFKVGSLTFSIEGSTSEYWEMLRFLTILPNKLLKTSAVPFSVFTILSFSIKLILSMALNFLDSEGFTVFQTILLSETFLSSKVSL